MSDESIASRAVRLALRSTILGLAFTFAVAAPTFLPLMVGGSVSRAKASASPVMAPAAEPLPLGGDEHLLKIRDASPNLTILPHDAAMAEAQICEGRWAVFFVPQWDSNAYAALHRDLSPLADAVSEDARVGVFSYAGLKDVERILPERWRLRVYSGGFLILYDEGKPVALFEDGHLPNAEWVREQYQSSK